MSTELTRPYVAATLDELVAGATDRVEVRTVRRQVRRPVRDAPPRRRAALPQGRSRPRTTGSCGSPATPRTGSSRSGRPGIYAADARRSSTTPIVGMALEGTGPSARLSILMTDCGDDLVPPGDDPVPRDHHVDFIDAHGGDARALHGLARRPRAAGPGPPLPVLRARHHRARARGRRRARARSPSPTRAGGCCPSARRGCTTWSARSTATRTALADALRDHAARPSSPATGSSATSATAPTAGPCSSTGPTPARPRRAGT